MLHHNMSDDWDTGSDTDITMKPRAPSPMTLRNMYNIPPPQHDTLDEDDEDAYRPTFVCMLPQNIEFDRALRIVPEKGVAPSAHYTLTKKLLRDGKESFEYWVITVLVNRKTQCTWELSEVTLAHSEKRIFKAFAYTWEDQSRVLGQYTNPFTDRKEFGWGPELYGETLFNAEWKEMPNVVF